MECKCKFNNVNCDFAFYDNGDVLWGFTLYPTPHPFQHYLLRIESREQLVFNYLHGVNENRIRFNYGENETVKIEM